MLNKRYVKIEIVTQNEIITIDNSIPNLDIEISGERIKLNSYGSTTVKITNLSRTLSNKIAQFGRNWIEHNTKKSDFYLELRAHVGRDEAGIVQIYAGYINSVNQSQPPDQVLNLECCPNGINSGTVFTIQPKTSLKQFLTSIANNLNLHIDFIPPDKKIGAHSFQGNGTSAISSASNILKSFNYIVYKSDNFLVVNKIDQPRLGLLKIITDDEIVGRAPILNSTGISISYLFDNISEIGAIIQISSKIFPVYNGRYIINKLNYNISTRSNEFTYSAEAVYYE